MQVKRLVLSCLLAVITSSAAISEQNTFETSDQVHLQVDSIWEENSELVSLHKSLVEIESISYNEKKVSSFLKRRSIEKGYTVECFVIDEQTGRENLYIYWGSERNTRIMLTSHVDTVPPYFPYKVDGNKIYGRGSVDDKASVVTQLIAFEQLVESGQIEEGDVALLLDIGEEKGADGAKNANEIKIPWETVIFGEPTGFTLVLGHKGVAQGTLKATGKTGHSSIPELGINAIDLLIDVLNDLRNTEFPGSEELGNSTLNIGVIEGGVAANVIPGEAKATLNLRVATPDLDAVDKLFEEVLSRHPRVEWEDYASLAPVLFKHDIPGYNTSIMPGGTDALVFKGDFEQYLIGPGTFESIHAADEHITIEELVRGVTTYKDIILYKLK